MFTEKERRREKTKEIEARKGINMGRKGKHDGHCDRQARKSVASPTRMPNAR